MELLIHFRSDADLVREALADRAAAFEVLVHRYQRKAHAIAWAAGVGSGAVDDVVQEAFLRGFQRLPELRQPSSFGPWFLTIVRNTARSHLRSAGRAAALEGIEEQEWRDPETLEGKELQELLWRRVAELPEGLREAIFLYYHEGRSVRAVARALGTSTAAAADRLRRGRDLLRTRLWKELRSELRDMLPSARAWKTKGRKLALIALASLAPALTRAAGAAAPAAGSSIAKPILGGLLMSGKKIAAAVSIAGILMTCGIVCFLSPGSPREDLSAPGSGARAVTASARPGAVESKSGRPASPAQADALRPAAGDGEPIAISGRTVSAGRFVEGVRLLAVDIASWQARIDEEFRAAASPTGRVERPDRLRQGALRAARAIPETASDSAGSFLFRGLPDGTYRIIAGREGFLTSGSTLVEVRKGAPGACQVELVPALAIEGRVVDGAGSPVAGAAIEVQARGLADGPDRIERLEADWREGTPLLAPPPVVSGAGGAFRIDPVEPAAFEVRARKEGFVDGPALLVDAGSRDIVLKLESGSGASGRVVDPAGAPVKGAEVSLLPARSTEVHRLFDWGRLDGGPAGSSKAITDAAGQFHIAGLTAASHVLTVAAERFPALEREVAVPEGAVDLGDLVLDAPRSISGEVRDPEGNPVSGAQVWVPRARRKARPSNSITREGREALVETRSAADGKFSLSGLPAGTFEVRASAEGFAAGVAAGATAGARGLVLTLAAGLTIHGKVIDGETSRPVSGAEVVFGFEQESKAVSDAQGAFEIRGFAISSLHNSSTSVRATHPRSGSYQDYNCLVVGRDERSPLIIALSRSERITGRVEDAGGRPAAGAQLTIEVSGLPPDAMGYNPAQGIHAFADSSGSYILDAPSSLRSMIGEIRFAVVAAHAVLGKGRSGLLRPPPAGTAWPAVDLVLGGSVIEGKVTEEDGKPIPFARVFARPAASPEDFVELPTDSLPEEGAAYSGPDGAYRLTGVEPGPIALAAAALGHAPRWIGGLTAGREPLSQDIVLSAGGSVEGRVVDGRGNPLPEAEVVAFPERKESPSPAGTSEYARRMRFLRTPGIASARSEGDGRFRISHLPDGDLTLVARAPGYEAAVASPVSPGTGGLELVLNRFGAILGSVRAADDRAAVTLMKVDILDRKKLAPPKGGAGVIGDYRTASEGELVFEHPAGRFVYDGLRPGDYVVLVQSPGFRFSTQEVTVEGGDEVPVEFLLDRGARIQGVVLDAETGLPVAGAQVGLAGFPMPVPGQRTEVRPFPEGAETLADGSFSIGGLADGQQQVMASHPLYLFSRPVAVEVRAGEASAVEIKLSPGGRVEGRIAGTGAGLGDRSWQASLALKKLEEGEPAAEEKKVPSFSRPVWMDPEGRFHADNLEPATYQVELKRQLMERGKTIHLGPNGGFSENRPVGPEEVIPLGQVEVRPRETTVFNARSPAPPEEPSGEKR